MVDNIGNEVAIVSSLQSFIQMASNGIEHIPDVKNRAMDMFATNVRLDGPTYSKAAKVFNSSILSIHIHHQFVGIISYPKCT